MKKFLLSAAVLIVFTLYAIRLRGGEGDSRAIVVNSTPGPNISALPSPTVTSTGSSNPPTSAPTTAPAPQQMGKYKDGTYTGSVADAFYGNIQVQAVISGGKIADVIFLQYPSDRSTSVYINSQAMPLLKQEAIQAQSAQVDGVSGATASSGAFIESLGNALQKAV